MVRREGGTMNQAQNIIPRLRQLAQLEKAQRRIKEKSEASKTLAAEIESLRDLLPTSILTHHDSFKARAKLSIAPVVRGICGACHLALPRGRVADLLRVPDDLRVCDNCGAFIYPAEEPPPQAEAGSPKELPPAKKASPTKRSKPRSESGRKSILH